MEIVVWTWGKYGAGMFLVDVWPQLRWPEAMSKSNGRTLWERLGGAGLKVGGASCYFASYTVFGVFSLAVTELAAWVPICPNAFPPSSQVLYHMQQDLSASQQENCCEALRNLIVDQDSRQEPAKWRVFHEPWTSQAMEKFSIPDLDELSLKHSETIWFVILQGTSGILPFVVGTCGHIYPL